jgi:homoserine dehydrogenase
MKEKEIRTVRIGLLGLGTVGTQLLFMLARNEDELCERYGIRIKIDKVLVRDKNKSRKADLKDIELTTEAEDITQDEGINMVVDCMGGTGTEKTRDVILKSLEAGKSVVMSSKKCLAYYGREIINAADRNQCGFRYEACVGGCIPISSVLRNMARGERILSIQGIFNASSNYILSKMEEGLSYEKALIRARELGLTEEDPTDDVEGFDTLYKLIILAGFAWGVWYDPDAFTAIPLSSVTKEAIREAECRQAVIKAIGRIRRDKDNVSCYVGPSLQEKGSLLAGVGENNNIILIESEHCGIRAFYGQGAGPAPTASAMYDDIISLLLTSSPRPD